MSIGDTIKSITQGMPVLLTGGKPGYRAGDSKLAWVKSALSTGASIEVRSPAFEEGQPMPTKYSVDGENVSPPISWSGSLERAQTFALIVEDPDAPTPEPFVHWMVYNIPASIHEIAGNVEHESVAKSLGDASQGRNSNFKVGWTGMAPPKGDIAHRYMFQLFGLNDRLKLDAGAGRRALFDAMAGHVVARGRLIGTFQR